MWISAEPRTSLLSDNSLCHLVKLYECTPLLVKLSVLAAKHNFLINIEHIPFKDHFLQDRQYWCEARSSQEVRDRAVLVSGTRET